MADQIPSSTPPASSGGAGGGSGLAPNVASLLCYVCTIVTGIIFLLIEKDNRDVRFHAWQAILLGAGAFVLQIAVTILTAILGAISGVLATIMWMLGMVVYLGIFVIWIMCMIKAYQGQRWKVPFIGDIAEKQAAK